MEEIMQAYSSAYYRPAGALIYPNFSGRDDELSPSELK